MCGKSPCDKPDCTWSEQFRHECEARSVMSKPKHWRDEYYALCLKHRGKAAVKRLVDEVNRLRKMDK